MSKRDEVREQIHQILKEEAIHIAKLEVHPYNYYIDKILSLPNIAVVDREAKTGLGEWADEGLRGAGWVKEVEDES